MNPVLRRLLAIRLPWWTYDGGLVVLAALTLAASWALSPGVDPEWVYLPSGEQLGETCLFLTVTGAPCPQCGMTRAFVYAARGDFLTAWLRNPGGLALFLWILVGGAIGGYRLARPRARAWEVPHQVVIGWTLFWLVGLYIVPYALRLVGVNPLP
jgi:Protein of unknown function (DUF2752)